MYLLFDLLGVAVLVGFGSVLCFILPAALIGLPLVQRIQKRQMKAKDERVKLLSELLNGVKVLKLYAWETSFERIIGTIRQHELRQIMYLQTCIVFAVVIVIGIPIVVGQGD
jgi:ABC-type bacteriocin/lantibiotic exporter with double-glycine peptidase domain